MGWWPWWLWRRMQRANGCCATAVAQVNALRGRNAIRNRAALSLVATPTWAKIVGGNERWKAEPL